MFGDRYIFKGRHAIRTSELKQVFDPVNKLKFFPSTEDIYANAPLVGFLYQRKANIDMETRNESTGKVYEYGLMPNPMMRIKPEATFNFQMIMLLDTEYEPDLEKRIDKAFRNENPKDEELFQQYLLGGVDVLYEKLIEGAKSTEEQICRLYDFIQEFQEKFNSEITSWKDIVSS